MNAKILSTLSILLVAAPAWANGNGHNSSGTQLGDPIPGLTADELARFQAGKALFEHNFTVPEGVGPIMNATSCAACHGAPATGGGENITPSDTGTANDVFHFEVNHNNNVLPVIEFGGPMRQRLSIAGDPLAPACTMQAETVPNMPEIGVSIRHTPPVFGFGLIDAIPDGEILANQGPQCGKDPSVYGVTNWGTELETLVRLQAFTTDVTRTQPGGAPRVGRFGWKSQTSNLLQFAADPLLNELGVTNPFFPRENTPNGAQPPPECQQATHYKQKDGLTNDSTGDEFLSLFYFQAFLAPPARGARNGQVRAGERIFSQVGCTDCHRAEYRTVQDYYVPWRQADGTLVAHRVDALSDKDFAPYSDFLVHDMGPDLAVGDTRVMGRAGPRFWRTTPLWGIHAKSLYLHNGSATTIDQAIDAHGGEGTASRNKYDALGNADKGRLLDFLNSL
ncbi:MAG: hypothetical protein JST54_32295 [Deltaproteobacteria bacterium]|nr:hypothetical protein [Deltaproteobacteria bacterium]